MWTQIISDGEVHLIISATAVVLRTFSGQNVALSRLPGQFHSVWKKSIQVTQVTLRRRSSSHPARLLARPLQKLASEATRLVTHALLRTLRAIQSASQNRYGRRHHLRDLYCRISVTSPLGFSQSQVSSGAYYILIMAISHRRLRLAEINAA